MLLSEECGLIKNLLAREKEQELFLSSQGVHATTIKYPS